MKTGVKKNNRLNSIVSTRNCQKAMWIEYLAALDPYYLASLAVRVAAIGK